MTITSGREAAALVRKRATASKSLMRAPSSSCEGRDQLGELTVATNERAVRRLGQRPAAGLGEVEPRGLLEDRLVELAKLAARFNPQFVHEFPACRAVAAERVLLATGAVQREHE